MPQQSQLLPPGQRPPPGFIEVEQLRRELAAMTARAEAAEAKLAAIPTESLTYCWYAEDSEREDDDWERHGNAVGNWLAQLRKEAQP